MKTTMKGAALFLALSALPFAASAQDWQGHGHGYDRGQQQQPGNGNSGYNGNRSQNDWRGSRGHDDRGWAWGNRDNSGRGWGDRGNWPQRGNHYYGRSDYGYRDHDRERDRDYRYASPRTYYPPNYGRRYYSAGYGYRPEPVWTVGNVYYGQDYAPTYAVDDYGDYGLYDPPRGYGWRRDDFGHYLLVAITSGIIADLLFGH